MSSTPSAAPSDPSRPSPPTRRSTPPAEVDITVERVQALLRDQHPDLADLPLRAFESGWDNEMFRLGDSFLVRLPRRAMAAACMASEQRWLGELAPRLTLPVPAPLRLGRPALGYPWAWSVLPWIDGRAADLEPVASGVGQESIWVDFLRSLHVEAPADAPENWTRGVPLARRADTVDERLERLVCRLPWLAEHVAPLWRRAVDAPVDVAPTWIHGDLHQRNILVRDGRFAAVIDWGDLTSGDRANDLASVWTQFQAAESRRRVRRLMPEIGPATWLRAQGWAVFFATLLLDTGLVDNARHAAMGRAVFERLHADLAQEVTL